MARAQPSALPDALLSRLSEFLELHMGLHFPRERWRDLERGLAAASREAGHADTETYARWLLGAPLTKGQIKGLACYLTIGETYFFRDKASLDILAQQILPALLQARAQGERRLRIWSAGCCSGEEPYSIAMLLDRLIPDPETWDLTILATDINPQFLRKAEQGVYSAWSFRGTPGWLKQRYFTRRRDRRFEIAPRIRRMVRFGYLNLAEDAYPSLVNDTNAMDIILCRNVLIYFARERAKQIVSKLHRSLVDGGWVITSPAETSATLFSEFASVQFPDAFLYRRVAHAGFHPAAAVEVANPWLVDRDATQSQAPERAIAPPAIVSGNAGTPADGGVDERQMLHHRARACADEGRLAEALAWCEKAIAADKLNPAHHYLLATIEQERGHDEAAERALGRVLYLEPDFILAHVALGHVCLAAGRKPQARRHFANALTLLRACPTDALLPQADGLGVGRLIAIISAVQSSLPRTPRELA